MRAETRKKKPPATAKKKNSTPRASVMSLPDDQSTRPDLRDQSLDFAEALFGPAPAITSSNKPDALLETCRVAYENGDRARLLLALRLCLSMRVLAPAWVVNAVHLATARWYSGEADTLDEAFGVVRRKNFNRAAYLKRQKLEKQVYRKVSAAKERGESITDELFEQIGRPLGLGKTLVKEYYTDVRKLAEFYADVGSQAIRGRHADRFRSTTVRSTHSRWRARDRGAGLTGCASPTRPKTQSPRPRPIPTIRGPPS